MSDRHGWDRPFVAGLAVGSAVMAFGVVGLLADTTSTRAREIVTWVAGAHLIHDAFVAPVAGLVGLVVARVVPRGWWRAVRAGLIATACTLAVAYPLLRGFTRDAVPDNASAAPLDYGSAVLTVLAVVWALVAGYLVGIRWLAARRERGTP